MRVIIKCDCAGLAVGHGGTIFTHHGLPTLLRAATPTTPTQSHSHTADQERNEDKPSTPSAMQALVSHVQAATSAGSAIHLAGTPSATTQPLPLTAITLPGASGTGKPSPHYIQWNIVNVNSRGPLKNVHISRNFTLTYS